MACKQYQKDISTLVDGELPPDAAAALLKHLSTCSACRATHRAMTALNSRLEAEAPCSSPALASRVKAKISGKDFERSDKGMFPLWGRASLLAAIVLLALGLGNLAGRSIGAIIAGDHRETMLEMIVGDSARTLADVVIDLSPEEK
jgi:anti-sigma factor RsiW